jgi:hypothetical protein
MKVAVPDGDLCVLTPTRGKQKALERSSSLVLLRLAVRGVQSQQLLSQQLIDRIIEHPGFFNYEVAGGEANSLGKVNSDTDACSFEFVLRERTQDTVEATILSGSSGTPVII